MVFTAVRVLRLVALAAVLSAPPGFAAWAQTESPPPTATPKAEPSTPKSATPSATTPSTTTPPSAKPQAATPVTPALPEAKTPDAKPLEPAAPAGKPSNTEIEPHGSPGIPQNATTESVNVPARTAVMIPGQSSYDDAFKSIKASLEAVRAAMAKAGLRASGHPITIFNEPDDKGFKYKLAVPIAKPDGKPDLVAGVTIGNTPSGKAIKFQHRGAYEDIDSTYDVITAYLDAKGLQVDNPYIEEYLTDLTTPDDPNLQVDIYVFVK